MIEMDRKHVSVMMEVGYIYIGMRRYKQARELFEGIAALVPDNEIPIVALGNVDFCEGRVKKSMSHYKKALKLNPKSLFARVYMGESLFFDGKQAEAMKLLTEVANEDKESAGEFASALLDAINRGFRPGKGRHE